VRVNGLIFFQNLFCELVFFCPDLDMVAAER
jgi:hypothetical protein